LFSGDQTTRCFGKLLGYFLEYIFLRRFPSKPMLVIGETSGFAPLRFSPLELAP